MLPDVSRVAALIGHPVRAKVLFSLLDGVELSASALASRAGTSPQAASTHLAQLVDGGLLRVRSQGRRRLFTLASDQIAQAIEMLASMAPLPRITSLREHTAMQRLRRARTCYDHLAGRLGVELSDALQSRGAVSYNGIEFAVTAAGEQFFRNLDIPLDDLRAGPRRVTRVCLDWTERRHHIAGSLGSALFDTFVRNEWVLRNPNDRALAISPLGANSLQSLFGLECIAW